MKTTSTSSKVESCCKDTQPVEASFCQIRGGDDERRQIRKTKFTEGWVPEALSSKPQPPGVLTWLVLQKYRTVQLLRTHRIRIRQKISSNGNKTKRIKAASVGLFFSAGIFWLYGYVNSQNLWNCLEDFPHRANQFNRVAEEYDYDLNRPHALRGIEQQFQQPADSAAT